MKIDQQIFETKLGQMRPILLNSWGKRISNPDQPMRLYQDILAERAARADANLPILLFVHGKGFSPLARGAKTAEALYNKWAKRFTPVNFNPAGTLCIGYGWNARSHAIFTKPNYRDIYDRAGMEAENFARVLEALAQIAPARPVHIICEGLGARVVMQALGSALCHTVKRAILCNGHELNAQAFSALVDQSARGVDFYNLTFLRDYRENREAHRHLPKSGPRDRVLAYGFSFQRRNWKDLNLLGRFDPFHLRLFRIFTGQSADLESLDVVKGDVMLRRILFSAPATGPSEISVPENMFTAPMNALEKLAYKMKAPFRAIGLYPELK